MQDLIDRAAGLAPGSALHGLRRARPEFVNGAEACRISALSPAADQGLPPALRHALARRMAALNGDAVLVAEYEAQVGNDPTMIALATGASDLPEPLATMAHHADLITATPTLASRDDIAKLEAAGLDNPQIVALSELVAFINFQTRIAAGLRLMGPRA